jgi:hypothetical protein
LLSQCGPQEKQGGGGATMFTHGEKDVATFRMITSQFCVSGYAKQSDIIRAFGVTSITGMYPLKYVMQPSFFSNANSLVMWVTPVGNIGR